MSDKFKKFTGRDITVEFAPTRCIHAARCVHGLPAVFNPDARPWITPDGAPVDQLAEVIEQCPTGALRYKRSNGATETPAPAPRVALAANGPLNFTGRITLKLAKPQPETRCALCRCGASYNKPFCDGSHREARFKDDGNAKLPQQAAGQAEGALSITPLPNGPLQVEGPLTLVTSAGAAAFAGENCFLCRCGQSANKPFCDGAHARAGFSA